MGQFVKLKIAFHNWIAPPPPYPSSYTQMQMQPAKARHYSLLESFLQDPNTTRMRQVHNTSLHIAILVHRGKIISVASNRVGSPSRGCGYSRYTIHAERNCIKKLGDITKVKDCDMYIMRIMENKMTGEAGFRYSKPCEQCTCALLKLQREKGLRNVFYTSNPEIECDC